MNRHTLVKTALVVLCGGMVMADTFVRKAVAEWRSSAYPVQERTMDAETAKVDMGAE